MTSRPLRCALLALAIGQAQADGPGTFEDIYGPSGVSFQGAVGFRVAQGSPATGDAQSSFGVAIDDMVVQWREYKLVDDAASCSNGACASVAADSSNAYSAQGSLAVTVVDASPYGQSVPVNDCNQDGDFTDAGIDDPDCNDNGITDVTARATSLSEPAGEPLVLDRIGSSSAYRGTLPISTVAGGAGILLFSDAGRNAPEITVSYPDRWDGSAAGNECRASSNPAEWGVVTTAIEIPVPAGNVEITRHRISDAPGSGAPPLPAGQDGDGFPDTNETVDVFLTVRNGTGRSLTNLTAQLATTDPKIDCILTPIAFLGSVATDAVVEIPTALRFKVSANADRSGAVPAVACIAGACSNGAGACTAAGQCVKSLIDSYAATFVVSLAADWFDTAGSPQSIRVELDLNSNAPVKPTSTFVEGFEGGLGNMFLHALDDSIASNTLSNGWRCQYHDPQFVGSNSFGDTECYLGFAGGQPIVNDWHLHDTSATSGGRAYQGSQSLHYGIHMPGNPGGDTYGLSQMDTIRTKNPINLAARICRDDPAGDKRACNSAADCVGFGGGPCVSAAPELSFKHQISLSGDSRSTQVPTGDSADRAVVAAQLFAAGAVWQKIAPYQNVYDARGTDNFSNCMFDPVDDGNTEDDYFDPSDPERRYGPSTACFPEFVFSYLGDTDGPFHAGSLGGASHGPGLAGSLGLGTWIESKFDLSRFRGRQIRIRWLLTSLKVSDTPNWEQLFHWNPNPIDDGWYVDDVRVTETLGTSAPTVSLDTADRSALPGCGIACTTLSAVLSSDPAASPSPGLAIQLATVGSTADRCVGGALLSEFWIDGDADGSLDDAADILLRPSAIDPFFNEAPRTTTHYAARVRCSSAPATCSDTVFLTVTVACPGAPGAFAPEAWWNQLRFTSKTTYVVPPANQTLDALRGSILDLRSSGSFGGELCLADGVVTPTLVDAAVPALGQGYYYLLRGTDAACNENRSWRTFSPRENPTDPMRRDTQITACAP